METNRIKTFLSKTLNFLFGIFFAFSFTLAGLLTSWVFSLFKVEVDNPTLRIIAGLVWALIVCIILMIKRDNFAEAFRFTIKKEEGTNETLLQKLVSIPLAFVFGVTLNRVITVLINILPLPESLTTAAEESVSVATDSKSIILIIIAVWLVSPIVEELTFRGLSYKYFENAGGRWLAIIATCIIFGACHGNYLQGAYAMVAALFCCLVIRLTGTIFAGMLLHIGFNSSNFLLSQIINANISDKTRNITDIIFGLLTILTITAIVMISKVDEK